MIITSSMRTFSRSTPLGVCVGLLAMLFGLGLVESLNAQVAGKISGVVHDAETGEPLIGCNVIVVGTTLGGSTDLEGAYFILNVPPGAYDIQASMLGFRKMIEAGVIVNSGRTTTTDFKLRSALLEQEAVVVQAVRPDVEPEKTSTSAIIRSEEVQHLAGVRDVGDVLSLAADVTDGHFRGGREGEEYYTLQGMGIVNPLNSTTAFMPIMSAVEEVEVITSGFGAQYGNAQSGVVNITMKEGRSDRWRTRWETRMRLPGRKHFGPSVFDPSGNPYLQLLLDPNTWFNQNPDATSQQYFNSMGTNTVFGSDTTLQLAAARVLWRLQTKRDMYRSYGNDLDYSVEAASGGPLDDGLRMFLALRSNVVWLMLPTEQPNIDKQVMGNIAADLPDGMTLRFSGGYSQSNSNVLPSSNGTGFYQWLWDRILGINYQMTTNTQAGVRFSHALSPSTFYELKLNALWTRRRVGSTPSPNSVPDSMIVNVTNKQIEWDKSVSGSVSSPDLFNYMRGDDLFRDELTRTVTFEASITSQVTKSHLLNGGIQWNGYLLDVHNYLNVQKGSGGGVEIYSVKPYEFALYAQDKMEFEGMIANFGVRLDVWNENSFYYPDQMVPYRTYINDTTWVYDKDRVVKKRAPMISSVQPRAGVSFPVSTTTVFHANYGSFMQRPSFQYVVGMQVTQATNAPIRFGNPQLKPQVTNSYDVGVMQGLGEGLTLDVSGYYKDVKNLIQIATFKSFSSGSYDTYFNRDYADIRGFRVALSKRKGEFTGSVNYHYSVATGKSATTSNAPPTFQEDADGTVTADLKNVPMRDILLDFDRTHNLIINAAYATGAEWGPMVLGMHPLADVSVSFNSFLRSGRPYTSAKNAKLINGARTPAEYNTNAKVTKRFRNFFGTEAVLYVEVFNLFDNKILNYSYLFATPNAGATNNNVANYEQYPIDDPLHGVLYWQDVNRITPFAVNQSFLIYDNAPRSINVGISIEM